jgi:serine/threonine-protein kinase
VIALDSDSAEPSVPGETFGPRPLLLPGSTIGGKYLIQRVLGSGGNGTVYHAEHASIGHQVAIKVVHPSLSGTAEVLARFGREARICGSLRHPNIGQVYDVGVLESGAPYMVMELQAGRSLREVLDEMTLSTAAIVEIGCQLLAALSAAHETGVVHRDVKPDNVMVVRDANGVVVVKLVDFGVCKQLRTAFDGSVTQRGMMVGSPSYMAPEQLRGEEVDARTDVYAVGALLYEAITERTPFDASTVADLLVAILQAPIEPPRRHRPDCPPELELAVLAALSRDPAQRPPTAEQFARALSLVPLRDARGKAGTTLVDLGERLLPDTNAANAGRRSRTIDKLRTLARDMNAARQRLDPRLVRAAVGATLGLMLLPMVISAGGSSTAHQQAVATTGQAPLTSVSSTVSAVSVRSHVAATVTPASAAPPPRIPAPQPRVPATDPTIDAEAPTAPRAPARAASEPGPAAEALMKAAATAFVRGDAPKAHQLYLQALAHEPQRPEALRGLGLALNRMSRRVEAARAFDRYLQLRPHADDASRIRALLEELQRSTEAVSDAHQPERHQPLVMTSVDGRR